MQNTRRYHATAILGIVAILLLLPGEIARAQGPQATKKHVMQPRAIADSTFAAALAVHDLAEEIRRGTLSPRTHDDPALRLAIEEISTAGAKRRRPKYLDKVPLWDFAFDSLSFEPAGGQDLIVTARAHFARDTSGAQRVTLRVSRNGTEWKVMSYGGLRDYFAKKLQQAKGGELK